MNTLLLNCDENYIKRSYELNVWSSPPGFGEAWLDWDSIIDRLPEWDPDGNWIHKTFYTSRGISDHFKV